MKEEEIWMTRCGEGRGAGVLSRLEVHVSCVREFVNKERREREMRERERREEEEK